MAKVSEVLLHGHPQLADDARVPAHPCLDEELPFLVQDLQDLGAPGAERFANQPASLSQDLVEVLRADGEFTEVGEDLLPLHDPVEVWHHGSCCWHPQPSRRGDAFAACYNLYVRTNAGQPNWMPVSS